MNPNGNTRLLATALLVLGALLGCDEPPPQPRTQVSTSPNATIVPAPLLSGRRLVAKPQPSVLGSAQRKHRGPKPAGSTQVLRPPLVIKPFSAHQTPPVSDAAERALVGVRLKAHLDWPSPGSSPHFYGLTKAESRSAGEKLQRRITVDLRSYNRMALTLEGGAFPLASGTQLLSRAERTGFLVQWPNHDRYRALGPGALRTLFGEARGDLTPMLTVSSDGDSPGRKLGMKTLNSTLKAPRGQLVLEQALLEGHGYGGSLLCRALLELLGLSPSSEVCDADRIPVFAEFQFTEGHKLRFVVDEVQRRFEAPFSPVSVPPRRIRFSPRGIPRAPNSLLTEAELSALRSGPSDGERGILKVRNAADEGSYLLLGGTPIAFLRPRGYAELRGLRPGDYQLRAISFYGKELDGPRSVQVPGKVTLAEMKEAEPAAP